MPTLRAGQTVTLVRRTVTGTDGYGDDLYTETRRPVYGCAISPGNTSEDIQGTASVLSDVIVHMPATADVGWQDALILPDGLTYRITGEPKQWQSPFTGTASMIEVPARVITGGPPAT